MTEETFDRVPNGIELAGDIVAAYVSNNPVPVAELPSLIRSVHSAISGLTSASASVAAAPGLPPRPRSTSRARPRSESRFVTTGSSASSTARPTRR